MFDKVILITGGKDKGIPYDDIGEALAKKTKHIVLIGKTGPLIKEALDKYVSKTGIGKDIKTEFCTTYEEAVNEKYRFYSFGDAMFIGEV